MLQEIRTSERRTSADEVFDFLYQQIGSLKMLPGTKISEADIAAKFGISRQPVRDAFSRLDNLNLLLIRPQKATIVKKFSLAEIEAARFVRLSIELEVLRSAVKNWDNKWLAALNAGIEIQQNAQATNDFKAFHKADYEFHKLLCEIGKKTFAFEIIQSNKAKVDRLCLLNHSRGDGMESLIEDHIKMIAQLKSCDADGLCETARIHLSRLNSTIDLIYSEHRPYFDK